MDLTILMPCLNEAETLEVGIKCALKLLIDNKVEGEILISDNGSTNGTPRYQGHRHQAILAIYRLKILRSQGLFLYSPRPS